MNEFMTAAEVAKYLNMGPKYFADKFAYKTLDFPKAYRFTEGGVRRWKRVEVEAWVESRREAA